MALPADAIDALERFRALPPDPRPAKNPFLLGIPVLGDVGLALFILVAERHTAQREASDNGLASWGYDVYGNTVVIHRSAKRRQTTIEISVTDAGAYRLATHGRYGRRPDSRTFETFNAAFDAAMVVWVDGIK